MFFMDLGMSMGKIPHFVRNDNICRNLGYVARASPAPHILFIYNRLSFRMK